MSNNPKAFAVVLGLGRLDRGVQRQHVRLTSDLFDDRDLLHDLLHGGDCLGNHSSSFLSILGRFHGDLFSLQGIVGVLPDIGNHLFHRR